eukprot:m.139544 g.139544  ORF g.139544 m.139544 type:complete len:217 (-) comp17630_c0_seq1:515-1165(-)
MPRFSFVGVITLCTNLLLCGSNVYCHDAPETDVAHLRMGDRQLIKDFLVSYCTAVDRGDWEGYVKVFTPDAIVDYTAAGGIKGSPKVVAEWLSMVFGGYPVHLTRQQHLVQNLEINFTSATTATLRAAYTAPMSINIVPFEYGPIFTAGGWYIHKLVKQDDGSWISTHLLEEIAYNQALVHVTAIILGFLYGVYVLFRWLRAGTSEPADLRAKKKD